MMILENVRVSYVKFDEPEEDLNGDLAYGCCVLIDKKDKKNLARLDAEIKKQVEKGMTKKWGGKKPKFKNDPLRDGDEELESGDRVGSEYKGQMFFNCSMKAKRGKPGLVDANKQPVMEQGLFYSGCIVNIDVGGFPYSFKANNGIGWGLQNVMFVEDSDRLDGRQSAEDAFQSLAPATPEEGNDAF